MWHGVGLLGPEPIAVDDYLADLADQVEEERMRDDNEAVLDEASFDREAAERYRRGNRLAEAERGTEEAFTGYLAMVANAASARRHHDEEFPEGIWVLRSDEFRHVQVELPEAPRDGADLWTQLFSDVNRIALWINSEYILTRLYSALHWFHKRLEVNVTKPLGKPMFSSCYSIFSWFGR